MEGSRSTRETPTCFVRAGGDPPQTTVVGAGGSEVSSFLKLHQQNQTDHRILLGFKGVNDDGKREIRREVYLQNFCTNGL